MTDSPAASRTALLITAHIDAPHLQRLRQIAPNLHIEDWAPRSVQEIPDSVWQTVEILYTSFVTPLPMPEQAPRLRWVQLYSAGPDAVLAHPLFRTSVIFTTTSGVHAVNIAEYVFTMILAWYRHFPGVIEWQQSRKWPSASQRASLFTASEVRGKTLGIVGYGSIGRQVARLASAFGMRILAMQRGDDHRDHGFIFPGVGDPEGSLPERYYAPQELHTLLGESDIVVIAIPLTPETREMFNDAAFRSMKTSAFLINIARGGVCNEEDLVHALQTRRIAGAALDVFQREPLPPDHPLWQLPNVFLTPHISGLTPHYDERAAQIFETNLRRYLAGEELYNVVDKTRGY